MPRGTIVSRLTYLQVYMFLFRPYRFLSEELPIPDHFMMFTFGNNQQNFETAAN
jgi:hypothetical protein